MRLRLDQPGAIGHALLLLKRGYVIALPTDTVYGVACDSLNSAAVERLYELKQRPAHKAIPLLLGSVGQMASVTRELPPVAERLAERFWPGALTLVLPAAPHLSPILTAGGDTIGLRLPDHLLVRGLSRMLGRPLAATSANLSGLPPATRADEVEAQFGESLRLILDGGPTPGSRASTVLDLTTDPPRLLREGPIPFEALAAIITTWRMEHGE